MEQRARFIRPDEQARHLFRMEEIPDIGFVSGLNAIVMQFVRDGLPDHASKNLFVQWTIAYLKQIVAIKKAQLEGQKNALEDYVAPRQEESLYPALDVATPAFAPGFMPASQSVVPQVPTSSSSVAPLPATPPPATQQTSPAVGSSTGTWTPQPGPGEPLLPPVTAERDPSALSRLGSWLSSLAEPKPSTTPRRDKNAVQTIEAFRASFPRSGDDKFVRDLNKHQFVVLGRGVLEHPEDPRYTKAFYEQVEKVREYRGGPTLLDALYKEYHRLLVHHNVMPKASTVEQAQERFLDLSTGDVEAESRYRLQAMLNVL